MNHVVCKCKRAISFIRLLCGLRLIVPMNKIIDDNTTGDNVWTIIPKIKLNRTNTDTNISTRLKPIRFIFGDSKRFWIIPFRVVFYSMVLFGFFFCYFCTLCFVLRYFTFFAYRFPSRYVSELQSCFFVPNNYFLPFASPGKSCIILYNLDSTRN